MTSSDYNLVYTRKSDNRIFRGRRVTCGLYKIIDSISGEKMDATKHQLQKDFIADKKNRARAVRLMFQKGKT